MSTTMTRKGQVTVPKKIRDALGITPGAEVTFDVNAQGEIVLTKTGSKTGRKRGRDRFDAARGKADIKYRTSELMALLRGGD